MIVAVFLLFVFTASARDVRVKLFWKTPPSDSVQVKKLRSVYPIDDRLIVTLNLEDYVLGVLSGEAATFISSSALKAMAVAARTFAMHHLGRHKPEGFDFCDTTHCQDLHLSVSERADLRHVDLGEAVAATESEALWHEGRAATTHYHRHCGGTTAAAGEIWPGIRAPYLRSAPDSFCLARGRADWTSELEMDQLAGEPRVSRRTASGRVAEIMLGGRAITAERFHQLVGQSFGWNLIRSNQYGISRAGSRIHISGFGHGHGVGLCQIGAEERGKAGHSYEQILAFYYPGTRLGISASGLHWTYAAGERVDAFAIDSGSAGELASAADEALTRAEKLTGMSSPKRPQVRGYPTLAIYRDATGSSGAVAATTSGFTIRTQPPALLRSRGVLASTLLHEMLHVLIDCHAHPTLPDWYGEGLALYLSNSAPAISPESPHGRAFAQVRTLAKLHGRAKLLDWVRSGLPPEIVRSNAGPSGELPKQTPATRRP